MDRCCQWCGEENRKQHGQKIVPSRFAQGHGPDDKNSVPSSDVERAVAARRCERGEPEFERASEGWAAKNRKKKIQSKRKSVSAPRATHRAHLARGEWDGAPRGHYLDTVTRW